MLCLDCAEVLPYRRFPKSYETIDIHAPGGLSAYSRCNAIVDTV